MSQEKYYIKIVQALVERDRLPVFTSMLPDHDHAIEYIPNIWATPKLEGSKLFIFQNVRGAFSYLNSARIAYRIPETYPYAGLMMWWCLAEGVEFPQQTVYRGLPKLVIEDYWESYPYYYPTVSWPYRPDDSSVFTLFADAVQLVHIVTKEEVERLYGSA